MEYLKRIGGLIMKKQWFTTYINNWSSEITWSQPELKTISEILINISKANGGESIADVELTEDKQQKFAIKKANEVLQKRVNEISSALRDDKTFKYVGKRTKKQNNVLDFAFTNELIHKLELNSCTLEQLDALPGLGKTTGKRIIDRRIETGPYQKIEEVIKIKGISETEFEKFRNLIYIDTRKSQPNFKFPAIQSFLSDPNFNSYVQLLVSTNGFFGNDENISVKERIISDLKAIETSVMQDPFFDYKNLKQIRNSEILNQEKLTDKLLALEANAGSEAVGGLIFDSDYPRFISQLIKNSSESLYIIMFFFRFEDEAHYPTDELVKEILDAKARGVSIKVIVDQDEETDPYNSKEINSNIVEFLKKKNIDIIYDDPKKLTHTKLVISDRKHVVVGSHNFTAGSFYAYDDTSIYIESEELALKYINDFNQRFK